MKRREMGGVVDNNLNVYGVEGLKVCGMLYLVVSLPSTNLNFLDLSILPSNVCAVSSRFSVAFALSWLTSTPL